MSITKHPTEETLVAYAAGTLDIGRGIVVAAHVEMCAHCRHWNARLLAVGGALLAEAELAPMADDAIHHVLARLDTEPQPSAPSRLASSPAPSSASPHALQPLDLLLPKVARAYEQGTWKWMGPGIHFRPLHVPSSDGARVFLLKAAPGTRMPHHTHTGTELTLVLAGAFAHAGGRFGRGDIDDADDTIDHTPVVEAGETCICLVAMEGKLQLLGLLGRVLQPFVRL